MLDNIAAGVTGADPAAPQSTESTTQATAQTAQSGANQPAEGTPAAAGQESGQQQHPARDLDKDAIAAAARRESESALKAEREKFTRTTELVKKYGATYNCFSDEDVAANYSAQGITTLEQLAAEVERQNSIQQTGVDPKAIEDVVNKLVQSNPLFKSMQAQQTKSAAEKAISDFKSDFPDVKVDPSKGLEQFGDKVALDGYLSKGLTLSEAYSLVNGKAIQAKSAAAATQAAINNIQSKSHVANPTGTETLPDDEVEVPADVMEMYKRMPQLKHMTDSELRKQYAKRHPKNK